jgi:hypothetical protein
MSIHYLLCMRDVQCKRLGGMFMADIQAGYGLLLFLKETLPVNALIKSGGSLYNSVHPLTRGVFFISLYAAFGPRFFILY